MNSITKQFRDDIADICHLADMRGGKARTETLTMLVTALETKDFTKIDPKVTAADLDFTDQEWTKLIAQVRFSRGAAVAEED